MKKIFFLTSLFLIITNSVYYSQDYILGIGAERTYKSITYFPTKASDPNPIIDYNNSNSPIVGKQYLQMPNHNPPYERDNIFRNKLNINTNPTVFQLRPNEKITEAKIVFNKNSYSGSGNFKVNYIGNNISYWDPEPNWSVCDEGHNIRSLKYSTGGSLDVTSIIKANIGNTINFAAYEQGNGDIHFSSIELHIWTELVEPINITAKNNFSGGLLNINVDIPTITKSTPSTFTAYPGISNISLEAIEQNKTFNNGDYYMKWHTGISNRSKWDRNGVFKSYNKNFSFTASLDDAGKTYTANLRKECNITFANLHGCGENGGSIKINGTTVSSPTATYQVVEQNKISAQAIDHTINGIDFSFSKWLPGNSASRSIDFYPSVHTNYEAVFIGRPNNYYPINTLILKLTDNILKFIGYSIQAQK